MAVATAFLLALSASPVAAQPECVDGESCAQAGSADFIAGEYDTAIEAFDRAHALAPNPLLLYNIGQAHRATGACEAAEAAYTRYLETGDETAADLARRHLAGETACPSDSDVPPLETAPETCAVVEDCYIQSVELFRENRYLEASHLMRRAYDVEPDDVLLYNIGRSYQEAGDCQRAAFYLHCYVSSGDVQALAQAERNIAALEPCPLAPLAIDVPVRCNVEQARAGRRGRARAEGVRSLALHLASAVERCLEHCTDRMATAVTIAAETIAPPPIDGFEGRPLPVHVYDEWVDWVSIDRDSGSDLMVLIYEQSMAVDALCDAVEDGQIPAAWLSDPEGCEEIDWLHATNELDAPAFSTFLSQEASAALDQSTLAGELDTSQRPTAIRLSVLELRPGTPPRPLATHDLATSDLELLEARFWIGQLDGDEALELLVVAEAMDGPDCVGDPGRQVTAIVDLTDAALELSLLTACYYDERGAFGDIATLSLVRESDSAPHLVEHVTVFDDCPLVDGRPKPWGDDDPQEPCWMVTHQRHWTYDSDADVWSPGDWSAPAGEPSRICPNDCSDEFGWDEE